MIAAELIRTYQNYNLKVDLKYFMSDIKICEKKTKNNSEDNGLLSESIKNNSEYIIKISKEKEDNCELNQVKKLLHEIRNNMKLIIFKAMSTGLNSKAKINQNYFSHQNSVIGVNNVQYINQMNANASNIFVENIIQPSKINCDEFIKSEFGKIENTIRERAKSSFDVSNSINFSDIKRIGFDFIQSHKKLGQVKSNNKK